MRRFAPLLGIVFVALLTILSGAIQGRMSNRWGPPKKAYEIAERLQSIPSQFGSWKLQSSNEIGESVLTQLECIGYTYRTYVNTETDETVRVAVLFGPSGAMSVHTPEICFSSRAYRIYEERQRVSVKPADGSEEQQFWALTFQANDADADMLRVYYAWSTGGPWMAADEPRFKFADRPFLYKIQLASYLPPRADLDASDPCRKFLEDFAPAARPYLAEP